MPKAASQKQFAFILSEDDRRKLQALADADQRAAGDWLRVIIRREYELRFSKPKRASK